MAQPDPGAPEMDLAEADEDTNEYERFEDLTRKLIQTPKPSRN